ncbi:PAS domain S-box-containing protein [Gillisia sp. Hel_I_86]|uniref:PAS domain S-box protein n=1 Tax=Gillisia sp. Hel_I_86 TaxID=1249981 RepID=UPI001199B5C6|nr:PAS domain S-box protein [Gillisia sp. Hel_I_86]TVZ27833.1 PAS domain S-box-containing protein [Gillisia sp. Hel_I_86]
MDLTERNEILKRALNREKVARKEAEKILEAKSNELYSISNALTQSNNQLKELLDEKSSELEGVFVNIIDAYIVMDLTGNVIKMNEAAINLIGYNITLETINLFKLLKKGYKNYTIRAFKQLLELGSYSNYQAVIITKDLKEKIVQINACLIYNSEGKPIAAQGIARDITEETAIKEMVIAQQKQLKLIMDNSSIGISLSSQHQLGLLIANHALCNILEYSQEEFKNIRLQDLTHSKDKTEFEKFLRKLFIGEIDTFSLENRYITKTNKVIWAKTIVTAIRDEQGNIEYQVATIQDITKEKVAKEKLKESENRLSTLISNLQVGVLLENEHRKITLTNKQFCKMFSINASPNDLIGSDCSNAAENSKRFFKNPVSFVKRIKELLEKKEIVIGDELELVNGKIYERNYIPIYNNGAYKGHLWSYEDVTIQKNYKESLKAQKEKYSNIIANMKLGLMEIDTEGSIRYVNQNFCEISGFSEEELLNQKATSLMLLPEDQKRAQDIINKRNKGISDSYEITVRTKTNELRHWLLSGAPNYDVHGKVIGSIGIHLDITDQKKLELQKEELLKSLEQQNDQLNEYAHIVSHDLKSPLRNISALLTWTKEDLNEKLGKESLENLDLMQDQIEKMDYLIENILKYSSISNNIELSHDDIDLNNTIDNIIASIYIPKHIEIKIISKLPILKGDFTRLQQLFQNIISNAVNYIDKEKGLIEIDYLENESHYIFSIKDNGIGIAEKDHKKIFTIFKSLGNHDKSTGIGLSIVKKIVDLYKGDIWLESTLGKGTTFYFSLKK